MLINNSFSKDTDGSREERCLLLQSNIDTYAAELGITGVLLTWAQTSHASWTQAWTAADVEQGELNEAYQEFQKKFDEVRKYYAKAKDLLISIIDQYGKNDDIMSAYDVDIQTPTSRKSLFHAIDDMRETDARLTAAGDPRVLPFTVITQLTTLRNEANDLYISATQGKSQKMSAFELKKTAFDLGSTNLKVIYSYAKLIWGDDSPKLLDLGFVPKSQIWTTNEEEILPAPKNLAYDSTSIKLNWSEVPTATTYIIEHKLKSDEKFSVIAKTNKLEWILNNGFIGQNQFRVTAQSPEQTSEPSAPLDIEIFSLGVIMNFRYEATEQMLRWDLLAGAVDYLVLIDDEPVGELLHVNYMRISPDPERDIYAQVWATNGFYATPRSDVVVIPKPI